MRSQAKPRKNHTTQLFENIRNSSKFAKKLCGYSGNELLLLIQCGENVIKAKKSARKPHPSRQWEILL